MPLIRSLDETSALVVNGTAGIGLHSALALAQAGTPNIVLVGRNEGRGLAALDAFVDAGLTKPTSCRETRPRRRAPTTSSIAHVTTCRRSMSWSPRWRRTCNRTCSRTSKPRGSAIF